MRVHRLLSGACLTILSLVFAGCDGEGGGRGDSLSSAPPPPAPPPPPPAAATASFTASEMLTPDDPVTFDASASRSSDGSDLQYFWDFGDGQQGGGRAIARLFAAGGARSVKLTVIDGARLTASQTRTINVVVRPAASASGSVEGAVTTVDGVAIGSVGVALVGGAARGTTDALGKVRLTLDLGVPVTLKLTKDGYADQFVTLQIPDTAGPDAYFAASMRTRDAALSLADAAAGGTVTGRDGAVLTLPANALVNGAGTAVAGAVDIAMTPVDVTQPNADGFPGRFDGLQPTGTITSILSYGTVEYVLSVGQERLHLAPGKTATIEIPLYGTLNADGSLVAAGDTTPLWSLDELTGMWVQEGFGTVVIADASPTGFALRATVTHLSWWNSDIGFDPYGPQPRCVYDTDSGIPGGNDTFATATICNVLAEFDRGPEPAPLFAARAQIAPELSPRILGYSRRAVLPIAGGVSIPVPADVDIALTGAALNGTWVGQRVVNGPVLAETEELILMRPIAGSGPAIEPIAAPFDATRALQDGQTALFGFAGTAYRYAHVTISQGTGSFLTGRVRLLQGATVLGTADFAGIPGQITALMPTDGQYVIEVTGLTNAPGAYRLQLELLGGIQTDELSLPFSVNTNVPAYFTYRGSFATAAPLTLFLAYAPKGGGAAGARIVAPDASVLLDLPPMSGITQTGSATLPSAGTYALEASSAVVGAFSVVAMGEQTLWGGDAPPLPADSVFSLIDLVADHEGKPVVGYTRTFLNADRYYSAVLMLRRWTGTAWESVGTDVTIDSPCNSGLNAIGFAFDSTNAPVIAYGNSNPTLGASNTFISARRFTEGAWQPLGPNDGTLPNVSAFGGACRNPPAVAFNAADEAHIAYRADNNVVLQRFDGAAWTYITTSAADDIAAQNYSFDLRADASGRMYVVLAASAFTGKSTTVRRLTTTSPPTWEAVGPNNGVLPEIGTIGLGGSTPRLRFDAADSPLIAFIACVGSNNVCSSGIAVYRYDGAQWSTTGGYQPTPTSHISNGNDLGFGIFNGEAYVSWVNSDASQSAPIVQTSSAVGWVPVGDDLGQVPQLWPHGLSSNSGYSMRLLVAGDELYLASAVYSATGVQIYLLRKVE